MPKAPWTSDELAEILSCQKRGPRVSMPRVFRANSKEIRPGDAFVALGGETTDGHLFIKEAATQGASLAIVEEGKRDLWAQTAEEHPNLAILEVNSSEEALGILARAYLSYVAPREIIGITGSVGKTTTRELMTSMLKTTFSVHGGIRSYNTEIGCALTILSMPLDTEILVLEYGTNAPGEIATLVKSFPPTLAVITEIAPAHLEGLGSLEGVLSAKMEICSSASLRFLAYNMDNSLLRSAVVALPESLQKEGVGYAPQSVFRIREAFMVPSSNKITTSTLRLSANYLDEDLHLEMPLFGVQHAYNFGFAYLVARHLGVTQSNCLSVLASFCSLSGRGKELRSRKGSLVIDETYNANPASMRAALENLASIKNPVGGPWVRKMAVLGGMRELGPKTPDFHTEILKSLSCLDCLILVGKEWEKGLEILNGYPLSNACHHVTTTEEAGKLVEELDDGSYVILVKGSRGYHLERVLKSLGALE